MTRKSRLFEPLVPDELADRRYKAVRDDEGYSPAKQLMERVFSQYSDKDGNFVKDFQTTGFSSRVWELSLFAYLTEVGVRAEAGFASPDYLISRPHPVALEAVTSRQADTRSESISEPTQGINLLVPSDLDNGQSEFTFQFAKVLRRKLQKRFSGGAAYWDLPHVRGRPFVLAVQAFHNSSSLFWTTTAAMEYLFGIRHVEARDTDGHLLIKPEPIIEHRWHNKAIPSGFFNEEDSVDLSAVLFSNSGTVSQFNRIGAQEALGSPNLLLIRSGSQVDPDPNASVPLEFHYAVGSPMAPTERFSQAMHVIHNPNARIPLSANAFPGAAEHHVDSRGHIESTWYGFAPIVSVTRIFKGPGVTQMRRELASAGLL